MAHRDPLARAAYMKRWREEHAQERAAYQKAYWPAYHEQHADEKKAYDVAYREQHREELLEMVRARRRTPEGRLVHLLRSARRRAGCKGLEYSLSLEWALEQWRAQDGRCKVTGATLDLSDGPDGRATTFRPLSPSLDRIDSGKGYTPDNVEIVCTHINLAFGQFGRAAFDNLVAAYQAKRRDVG